MDEPEWEHILQIKTAGHFQFNVGRTDKYVMGNGYGLNYGDIFDRAEMKYAGLVLFS